MACEPAIATLETEYLTTLQGATNYTLDGSARLQLTNGNGKF